MSQYPLYFAGLRVPLPSKSGYICKPHAYEYFPPANQLNANQNLQDFIQIDPDADFLALAWYITPVGNATFVIPTSFTVSVISSNFYQLFSSYPSNNISQYSSGPSVLPAPEVFPASGRILLQFQETAGLNNNFGLVLDGVNLFKATR